MLKIPDFLYKTVKQPADDIEDEITVVVERDIESYLLKKGYR